MTPPFELIENAGDGIWPQEMGTTAINNAMISNAS
jgi:hypothetical protein